MMRVEPRLLTEVISVRPAIWPRWRSSGLARLEATVSGLAPGSEAYADRRKVDLRERRDRKFEKGKRACEHEPDRKEGCRDRPRDEGGRNIHFVFRAAVIASGEMPRSGAATCGFPLAYWRRAARSRRSEESAVGRRVGLRAGR